MWFIQNVGTGLTKAFHMAWASWWALVLGLTIAGAVEAFVDEDTMVSFLGGQGLKEIGWGTLLGAASSSCSFGAVATTKSLFKKGASAAASIAAFQFASTNLVIELGLVMWVLLGWQFVAANAVAGLFLIGLMAIYFNWIVPDEWLEQARRHVRSAQGVRDPVCGMEVDPEADDAIKLETNGATQYFCSEGCKQTYTQQQGADPKTWKDRLLTADGWKQASLNSVKEWDMLWFDIVIGFVIAGLIAAFVPREWWAQLFGLVGAEGSLSWLVWSAVAGVTVGVITFVCSVGNVPFALLLWQNGIAFGGVMSFIFADLIVPNITDAYRRYYGGRMAAVIFVGLFICAIITGVGIHYLWNALSLVPDSGQLGGTAPEGYTKYLNAVFTPIFVLQLYLRWQSGDDGDDSQ
jgi:uncharacterized membrane protein YraQ (UPF0718 family)